MPLYLISQSASWFIPSHLYQMSDNRSYIGSKDVMIKLTVMITCYWVCCTDSWFSSRIIIYHTGYHLVDYMIQMFNLNRNTFLCNFVPLLFFWLAADFCHLRTIDDWVIIKWKNCLGWQWGSKENEFVVAIAGCPTVVAVKKRQKKMAKTNQKKSHAQVQVPTPWRESRMVQASDFPI